jgi:hypothetical protein
MKKEGGFNYLLWISIAILILIMVSFSAHYFTGSAIYPVVPPADCSDSNVRTLWDSIFQESSTGISINSTTIGGQCSTIRAMKIKGTEAFLMTYSTLIFGNSTTLKSINAFHGNFSSNYTTTLTNSFSNEATFNETVLKLYSSSFIHSNTSSRYLVSDAQANQTWTAYFRQNLSTLTSAVYDQDGSYIATGSDTSSSNYSQTYSATILTNYTLENLYHVTSVTNSSCAPNWTRQETACFENETQVISYNDTNICGVDTDKPETVTLSCDFDKNGVIGSDSSLGSDYNLSVYISGTPLNNSLNYSGSATQPQTVEIKKDGVTAISFKHNFASSPLDLKNTSIRFASATALYGFIVINGIDDEKWVLFSKKSTSANQVCVKDSFVSNIANITTNCSASNEYLISCPGSSSGFGCAIINNSYLNVSGLDHSAVKEVVSGGCSTNWTCSSWSTCTNLLQNRTCVDSNNCNTTSGRPALSQACTPQGVIGSCSPNWNCTEWTPSTCSSKENQTRICTDLNNCNTQVTKPEEEQTCANPTGYLKWILIGLGVIIVVVIIILVISMMKKKDVNPQPTQFSQQPQSPQPPRPITPQVTPVPQPIQSKPIVPQGFAQQQAAQPTLQERQFPSRPQQIGQYPTPQPQQPYIEPNNNNQPQN